MSSSTSTSTPNKKPAVPTTGRKTPNSNAAMNATTSSPSRPSSATNGQTSGTGNNTSTAPNGLNRTRSTRTGTPLSARAAVRKPNVAESTAEADAKAEMHARMEELAEKLAIAELATVEREKQLVALQAKLDESLKEQGMMEENMHESSERIEELENAKKESVRARRELEQIYESERAVAMKEKEEAAAREEEMKTAMQRMKESLAQREMRAGLDDERRPMVSRSASGRSAAASPNPESGDRQFAPSSVQRSDSVSRNNSKLVMQKDKIIESLRLELAESQIKVVEMEHMGGGHLRELQKQMYEIKMQNARLMEENESFQLLLSEKTLNGDFLRPYNSNMGSPSRPPSRNPGTSGTSLADELESEEAEADSEGGAETDRRLRGEVNSLKDQNKALTLYINNIISRLLQHEQFEQILDKTPDLISGMAPPPLPQANKDKDLPPPPPEKDVEQPSLLQRARSVMGPKRPRPRSQQLGDNGGGATLPRANENPETAPSVPIGPRMVSGHRRANSDWPAASVVTNMYRGPSPSQGPLSPGLTSPTGRSSAFFTNRVPSNSSVPTISEAGKENSAPRDSKLQSNRNSMISSPPMNFDPMDQESVQGFPSPPRSTTSSGEKIDNKNSGAVMMGSKPRPLRLVQEAKDEDAAKKNANRGSWFGWMNKGVATAPGLGVGGYTAGGRSNSDQGPTQ